IFLSNVIVRQTLTYIFYMTIATSASATYGTTVGSSTWTFCFLQNVLLIARVIGMLIIKVNNFLRSQLLTVKVVKRMLFVKNKTMTKSRRSKHHRAFHYYQTFG